MSRFEISQKPSFRELGAAVDPVTQMIKASDLATHTVTANVMAGVYLNLKELDQTIPWSQILNNDNYTYVYPGNRDVQRGQHAIRRRFGTVLASVMGHMQWDLSSPEMVYISGLLGVGVSQAIASHFITIGANLRERISTQTPTVQEQMQQRIGDSDNNIAMLNRFSTIIEGTIADYAQENLPVNPKYLEILRALLYANDLRRDNRSSLEKAYAILLNSKNRDTSDGFPEGSAIDQAYYTIFPTK